MATYKLIEWFAVFDWNRMDEYWQGTSCWKWTERASSDLRRRS